MRRICGQSVDWIASCLGSNWIVENKVPVYIFKRDHSHYWLTTEVQNFDEKFSKTVYLFSSISSYYFQDRKYIIGLQRYRVKHSAPKYTGEREQEKKNSGNILLFGYYRCTCFRWACKYYRTHCFLVETLPWMFSGVQ